MIASDLLIIRAVKEADLPVFFEHLSDMSSLGEFLPVIMPSETQLRHEFAADGLIGKDAQRLLIVSPDGEMLGYIWAFKSVPYFDATEVGYQIFSTEQRGKGYASEALRLFRDYLFESSQVNRLELRISTDNTGSQKVAEKLNFVREGICREAAYSKGRLHDMCIYAQLRREWQEQGNTDG
ncbi:GNAT family N-acetyltransferase [Aliamphritea ceti]|uniref:GNAT family N-acetyltransferase n=1 Tax=Aliamphritea ceti TaxID=1524258 RepID=UPI0021C3B06E|nr:GNAT family protein [Aliamphritea ceti]